VPNIPDCKLKLSYADNGNVAKLGTITDYSLSGVSLNGTLYGDCYVDADGMHFSGADYINCGNDNSMKVSLPVTIMIWIKCSLPAALMRVLDTANSDGVYYYGFWVSVSTDGEVYGSYGDGGAPAVEGRRTKRGTSNIANNEWNHVAIVFRGATDISIYINGIDDGGTYSGTGGDIRYGSYDCLLGKAQNGYYTGALDGFQYITRALSQPEIMQLYSRGRR